jgi:hypothetical protein
MKLVCLFVLIILHSVYLEYSSNRFLSPPPDDRQGGEASPLLRSFPYCYEARGRLQFRGGNLPREECDEVTQMTGTFCQDLNRLTALPEILRGLR